MQKKPAEFFSGWFDVSISTSTLYHIQLGEISEYSNFKWPLAKIRKEAGDKDISGDSNDYELVDFYSKKSTGFAATVTKTAVVEQCIHKAHQKMLKEKDYEN